MTSATANFSKDNSNKPWFATYQRYGISPNIHMPNDDTSLIDILEKTMQNHPNRIASLSMGRAFTYRELDLSSRTVAAYLQALGLVKGDKVAIMLPNVIQYTIVAVAVLRAGLILVNVNPLYTSRELEHQLQDAEAKAIFILENFAHTYQAVSPTLVEYVIMCRVGDMLGKVKGTLVNFGAKYIKKMVPDWQIKQFSWFSDVLKSNPALYQRPDLTLEDTALLQYTGGTTGVAKGAMLTHGNLIANILQIDALVDTSFTQEEREREHVILTALPLYRVFACSCLA
jgi:long-chain acyl-CoA synthetase